MSENAPEVDDAPEATETEKPETEAFDADRAQAKIRKANSEAANLRKRLQELEPLAQRAKELEDSQKTEAQKAQEASQQHLSRAEKAESELMRLRVAVDKGLTPSQAKRLVGATEEELAADADELLKDFGGKPSATTSRRPQERLRGGGDPTEEADESDPAKLAASISAERY